eukprot:146625-Hanusia_phi.AAC.1
MPDSIIDGAVVKQWNALIETLAKQDAFFVRTFWKTIRAKFFEYVKKFREEQKPSGDGIGNTSGNGSEVFGEREKIWQQ